MQACLRELTLHWAERAREIPGFRLHTRLDTEALAGVALFSIDGVESTAIERLLSQQHQIHVKYRRVKHSQGLRTSTCKRATLTTMSRHSLKSSIASMFEASAETKTD